MSSVPAQQTGEAHHVRRAIEVMGTVFSVDVVCPDDMAGVDAVARLAIDDVATWLHWVDATFSTYRDDSAISRLARRECTVADCPPEVAEVLDLCAQMERRTGGYFSARAGRQLDPTGLVKGWSVEVASDRLHAAGFVDHCINGGGDIQARGRPSPERPWSLAVADPFRRGEVLTVVQGTDIAVATSGTSERGAHIVDPFSGRAATALAAVTIVGRDVVTADGYATAAMAMGSKARSWLEHIAGTEGYDAIVVDRDGEVWRSPARQMPGRVPGR